MQSVRARPMVEGALLAALTALLGLLAFYTGLGLLQPLPVLLAYIRHGGRLASLVAIVAAGVLALWAGPLAAVGSLGFVVAVGLLPGWALRRGAGLPLTITAMTIGLLALTALGLLGSEVLWHTNVWGQAWQQLSSFMDAHQALLATAGLTAATALGMVRTMLPVAALLGATGESLAVYLLAAVVFARLGHPLPRLLPFARWRLPPLTAWGVLVALGVLLVGERSGHKVLVPIALNPLLLAALAYAVVGLAISYGWLRRRGLGRGPAAVLLGVATWLLSAFGLSLALPLGGLLASQLSAHPGQLPGDGGNVR